MKIYKFDNEFFSRILTFSKFQKVVLVYDKTSNMELIGYIKRGLEKDTVFLSAEINNSNIDEVLVGARCVVEVLSTSNYFLLRQKLDKVVLISVAFQEVSTRWTSDEIYLGGSKNLADYFLLANLCVEKIWCSELSCCDSEKEYEDFYSLHQKFFDRSCDKLIFASIVPQDIGELFLNELKNVNTLSIYLYLRLLAIYFLLQSFKGNLISQLDVYKVYQNSIEDVNICYQIATDERVFYCLKNKNENVVKIIEKILKNIKLKNTVKLNKELNNLKINAKNCGDNLLKYCYLFNIFDKC